MTQFVRQNTDNDTHKSCLTNAYEKNEGNKSMNVIFKFCHKGDKCAYIVRDIHPVSSLDPPSLWMKRSNQDFKHFHWVSHSQPSRRDQSDTQMSSFSYSRPNQHTDLGVWLERLHANGVQRLHARTLGNLERCESEGGDE